MKNNILKPLTICLILLIGIISLARISMPPTANEVNQTHQPIIKKKTAASYRPYKDPEDLRRPYNWRKSSEMKRYPTIKRLENDLTIRVSLKGNRVYILRDGQRVYTMLASSGIYKNGKSLTPTGNFKINYNRGISFYNPELNEGANNWTSWDEKDEYLFHSVPTKSNGRYNIPEARKLGIKAGSHGCIRLSVSDSNWLMKNIPYGTKVIIKNN
ncbi:L,D-transpeptidase [Lactobacillus bombicola]|uniref:Murein L,D-transpeptidase n=1 Tax=Lactobacillus bombicola TaxID=1505723 RepID=A0ABX9LUU5_9LACO|nr:L,D-transpeptidase [Lactobacillus bombicola]RHW51072.1 murein L,D-transpeptidase [Lactobacillus bombicola]RHW52665.1 murein L,D-transpeptidase [Lactobacillus bombicola]